MWSSRIIGLSASSHSLQSKHEAIIIHPNWLPVSSHCQWYPANFARHYPLMVTIQQLLFADLFRWKSFENIYFLLFRLFWWCLFIFAEKWFTVWMSPTGFVFTSSGRWWSALSAIIRLQLKTGKKHIYEYNTYFFSVKQEPFLRMFFNIGNIRLWLRYKSSISGATLQILTILSISG